MTANALFYFNANIMADELIDILNEYGEATGDVRLKSEAHRLGLYHASVHIWFYTEHKELLFQKRAGNKDTYPGLWDISVAGHISAGEDPKTSAIREIQEEIGLSIMDHELDFLKIYPSQKRPAPGIIDNEFHHIYVSELKTPITQLTLQKEEVSDIQLLGIEEFEEIRKRPLQNQGYVPHDSEYLDLILKEITNRIG